jgi:hypothetical protein
MAFSPLNPRGWPLSRERLGIGRRLERARPRRGLQSAHRSGGRVVGAPRVVLEAELTWSGAAVVSACSVTSAARAGL